MDSRKCSFPRLFATLSLGVFLCLSIISLLDHWTIQQIVFSRLPQVVNKPWMNCIDDSNQNTFEEAHCWRLEYQNRVQRMQETCNSNRILTSTSLRRARFNRIHLAKKKHCQTKLCPIIVDEQQQTLFCFIPKVASSQVKKFFLNISGITINETLQNNGSAMHIVANEALQRISPMYYPSTRFDKFYKIIFVRHPFDRLVSAFRNKAERSRDEVPFFYAKYWDPIMKKLRPRRGSLQDRITFMEFVWYLTNTDERDFDDHWAPFWSRCDPCLVDYDFIGKLETAKRDFPYAFREASEIAFSPEWWDDYQPTNHSVALRYFSSVPEVLVRRLYTIFRPDFELFGYSVNEFLPGNVTTG